MGNSKDEVLARINEGYLLLTEALQSLYQVDPGNHGGSDRDAWTAKDLSAHIAAWEQVLLRFHIGGEAFSRVIELPGAEYHVTPFDEVNAHLFEEYESLNMDEVSNFARETHQSLMTTLVDLPEEAYQEPPATIVSLGLDPYPLYEYIAANTYDHYAEHLQDVKSRI